MSVPSCQVFHMGSGVDWHVSSSRCRCLGGEPSTNAMSVDDDEILQQDVRERLYAVCGNESISFSDSRNVRSGCTSKRTASTRAASYVCSHSKLEHLEHNLLISSFPLTFKLVLTCRKPFSRTNSTIFVARYDIKKFENLIDLVYFDLCRCKRL